MTIPATDKPRSDAGVRNVWVHRAAMATLLLSLVPITLGSLVTTLGAGMAFLDWPTSDGESMLAYPWLESAGDKFVEHGHRLAGVLIGVCSIGLCGLALRSNASKKVKQATLLVLVGVIVQGLLGGLRVRLDLHVVALGHSVFGCLVFTTLWLLTIATGRSGLWVPGDDSGRSEGTGLANLLMPAAFPVVCLLQYVAGGFVRHLGLMLHTHLAGAAIVVVLAIAVSRLTPATDLCRRRVRVVWMAVGIQILLGMATWLTKYGLPELEIQAYYNSVWQQLFRTVHTVTGMAVVASAAAWFAGVAGPSARGDGVSRSTVEQTATTVSGAMN